ncbi:hypothetical protein Tco_0755593 [Tanacetum coccineum]
MGKQRCEASPPLEGVLVTSVFELSSSILGNIKPRPDRYYHLSPDARISYDQVLAWRRGRVIKPDFLEDEPNLRNIFAAIGFDCLLDLDKQICPIFSLQFYKSVCIIRNLNGTISIAFVIDNVKTTLTLENFAWILKIPGEGVCVYTSEWPISSIIRYSDPHPNIYPPPHEESSLIRDALFHTRTEPKYRTIKGDKTILDPFQMINTELKEVFKKWDIILSENAISLIRHKDHLNASLCYMLYCLTIEKPFNLSYYIAQRMVSVTQSSDMTLPYVMLLTRLYKHVYRNHPYTMSNEFQLVDHVMTPLSNKRVFHFKTKGKRPRLLTLTDSGMSESSSSSSNQEVSNDPMDNYTLDLIPYLNQLPPIEGGESSEFKQTKGMNVSR